MKKIFMKLIAFSTAFAMMFAMITPTFAVDNAKGILTINGTTAGTAEKPKNIELYQMFSATVSGTNVAYTLNSAFEDFFTSEYSDKCGGKTGEELSEAAYTILKDATADGRVEISKKALTWILKNQTTVAGVKTTFPAADTTTIINDLAYGYYVVYPVGAANITGTELSTPAMMVSVTNNNAAINLKSAYPTVDKTIIGDDNKDKPAADFNVGDIVRFKLTSVVPDMTGYTQYTFKFIDTLSAGLTFEKITSVKIGEKEIAKGEGDNTYSLLGNGQTITITLNNFISNAAKTGAKIEVIYEATLNEKAVTGMNPNTNKAQVEYSNNPSDATSTDTSVPDEVDVHTFDFTIFKYYLNGEIKESLAGAEFELYAADNKTKINIVELRDENNKTIVNYRQATDAEAKKPGFISDTIVSDDDGKVNVKDLKAGTYYLKEIKAPDGYNKLIGDIKIVIEPEYNTDTGKLDSVKVTYTYNGVSRDVLVTGNGDSAEIPVENKTGNELPNTGGTGTVLFLVAGAAILGITVVASIVSKKKEKA